MADILPGLEAYGDLTLVDEVNCATDTTHEFHELPAGASSVQTILGSPCRVLPHPSGEAGFFSYRLGKGKGLVAHDMYLLVVEYPDDVPRTASLLNRAMNSRNGWHTGISVGETMVAHIIGQTHPESMNVPLSGTYKRLEQVMFLNEKVFPYDTTDSYIDAEENGFDVIIHAFSAADSPDSAGPAVRAIRLYRMNDEKGLATPVKYPAGNAPKRHVTWRDEMGKHSAYTCNADQYDNFRMKMRLMKELGLDTWSRDLLEFGYNQNWDIYYANRGNWFNSSNPGDRWTTEVDIYADAGIYLLPFYEYAGSRGPSGLGVNSARKAVQMFRGGYGGHFNLFVANANGASGANVDITDPAAYEDFAAILDSTILRYKDKANFIGAWIRNRGSMPVSFSDNARNRFCADTGRASGSVSIDALSNVAEYGDEAYRYICQMMKKPALYQEYRTWWNGKRRDWLKAMQKHLADGGLSGAKVYFSGVWGEAGWEMQNLEYYRDYLNIVAAQDATAWKALSGSSSRTASIGEMSGYFTHYGIDNDAFTWYPDEYNHAAPRNDPETYTGVSDVALCYPYNCVYTTVPAAAAGYRNASGDLFFSRHFCLYEGCGNGVGYFTTEMDRCGRAIMLPELHAMAYQDPTLIGFMQGGHLARNSTKEFREFNEYFLSLPAAKGTVLLGGGWGEGDVTIRKYSAAGVDYYAAINTSSTAHPSVQIPVSSGSALYDSVTGARFPVASQKATIPLEPFQMRCFTTAAPDTPRFLVAVPSPGSTSAAVPLAVSTLGGSSATLRVSYSTSPTMAGAVSLPASTLTSAGTNTVSLAGLSPNTTYYVTFGLTNALAKGASHVLSFTTAASATSPRGSFSASPADNAATLVVTLSSLGDGASSCGLYAVLTPSSAGLAAVSRALGTRNATGSASFTVSPLSTEETYLVEVFATNSLGVGVSLGTARVTTPARPDGDTSLPEYRPGLTQHRYGCTSSSYPDFTVGAYGQADADRALGTIMADVTGNPGPTVVNEVSGLSYQWANNTTFVYEGQMFFAGGVAYNFFHCVDDGVAIELDGESFTKQSSSGSSGYQTITQASKTYAESGWHDIRAWVYDWSGGKGYGSKVSGLGYATGLGWNTNGCTSVTANDVSAWSNLRDAGDGALLRTRVGYGYVAIEPGLSRSGDTVSAPLRVRSYDEDDALAVHWAKSLPADPFSAASWTGSVAVPVASWPGESTAAATLSGLGLRPGDTVYAAARLSNARLGHESWSAVATYTVPDDQTAPVFGTCEAKNVTWSAATLSFALSALGTGNSQVAVAWTVSPSGGSSSPANLSFTAAGTKTADLAGLAADTQYTVSATATGSNGKTATKSFMFRTARVPLALGAATGTCDGTGTHGTAKVTVERADVAATLVLRIDGAVAKTWTGVSAGGEYSWDFDLAVGDTKVCSFTLSATGCADVVKSVTVEGRVVVDWFHVPFGDDYEGWTLADGATDPHDGGSWTLSGSRNASALSTAGGARHIALAAGEGGAVAYAPAFPSEANRTLEISGRAKLRAFSGRPDAVPAGPIAGLALGTADGAPVLFGLSSGGWTALSGATAAADAWVDWSATIDFGAGTVVYRLGGARLSAGGVSALPLAATAAQARRVSFSGSGAIGAFQGVYAEGDDGTVRLYRAAIRVDGTGLEFRTVSGSDRFVIGLKDAQAGLRYVAFAAASLDTPAGDWVCAACSEPAAAGAQVDLPCAVADDEGNPIPAQFFRIYGASEPIAIGTRYGDLNVEAGE